MASYIFQLSTTIRELFMVSRLSAALAGRVRSTPSFSHSSWISGDTAPAVATLITSAHGLPLPHSLPPQPDAIGLAQLLTVFWGRLLIDVIDPDFLHLLQYRHQRGHTGPARSHRRRSRSNFLCCFWQNYLAPTAGIAPVRVELSAFAERKAMGAPVSGRSAG